MWRHFDAGLYQFLKNHVYIPLMKATMPHAVFRGLLALIAVSLSAAELIIEKIGKALWSTSQFQEFRRNIGEENTRRLIALSMLATVIPGIFGVFFFLGEEGTGAAVFQNVLINGFKDVLNGNVVLSSGCAGLVFHTPGDTWYFSITYAWSSKQSTKAGRKIFKFGNKIVIT
ncbi:hypothetical protein OSTOST_11446, partial [Ostertagia ostertagi]